MSRVDGFLSPGADGVGVANRTRILVGWVSSASRCNPTSEPRTVGLRAAQALSEIACSAAALILTDYRYKASTQCCRAMRPAHPLR